MKMPPQFYMFVMVASLYFWPWQLFSGDSFEAWLASVITMQLSFVIACNILSNESWIDAIMIVELICMIINATLFWFEPLVIAWHGQAMLFAFIIELLIITMSLQGELVRDASRPLWLFGFSLRNSCGNLYAINRGGAHT